MSDTINLWAESDRNIIGDDSSPALTLENSSTGNALYVKTSGTATVAALKAEAQVSAPTVAALALVASCASGAYLEFQGPFVSTASINNATRAVRVKIGDDYYWMGLSPTATCV